MTQFFVLFLFVVSIFPSFGQQRKFSDIFPNLPDEISNSIFNENGYIKTTEKPSITDIIGNYNNNLDKEIFNKILNKSPNFIVEHLLIIPHNRTILEVYNALGNIRDLKGRNYSSFTRGENIPLFEDATRIESAAKNTPIADPGPSSFVPNNETIYIKLKDANFGMSYYRGDMSLNQYGLKYILSNNKSLTYLFIPVIKEENFTAQLYFEPITEGILLYSIAGVDVSNFISNRIHIPSAISKRIEVIISWVSDGLK